MTDLRKLTKNFASKTEDAALRNLVLKELEVLLEHTESNRKTEAAKMEEKKANSSSGPTPSQSNERRILSEQLKLTKNQDVV